MKAIRQKRKIINRLELTEAALAGGHNVVIDRCNFDESQRQHWLRIGARHGATIVAAFLNTPIRVCKQRVAARRNHPTLGPGRESMQIVERFRHCLLYTSPSPRDATLSRMPSSA